MSNCEKKPLVAGKLESKLTFGMRGLQLLSDRWQLMLTAGCVILLCLTWAGCNGFFISPSISSIYVTPAAATIAVKNTVQLTATATYSDGSTGPLTGSSVGWTSSDTTVANVTSPGGLVTGVSTGSATITVSAQGASATATITVSPSNVTSIVITTTQGSTSPQSTATISGAPITLQFYAYANGLSSNDVTNAVTWTSSNTSVATISTGLSSGSGMATSVAAGTTNITASIATTSGTVTSNTIVLTVQ